MGWNVDSGGWNLYSTGWNIGLFLSGGFVLLRKENRFIIVTESFFVYLCLWQGADTVRCRSLSVSVAAMAVAQRKGALKTVQTKCNIQ